MNRRAAIFAFLAAPFTRFFKPVHSLQAEPCLPLETVKAASEKLVATAVDNPLFTGAEAKWDGMYLTKYICLIDPITGKPAIFSYREPLPTFNHN